MPDFAVTFDDDSTGTLTYDGFPQFYNDGVIAFYSTDGSSILAVHTAIKEIQLDPLPTGAEWQYTVDRTGALPTLEIFTSTDNGLTAGQIPGYVNVVREGANAGVWETLYIARLGVVASIVRAHVEQ
jgi:hypothetical protein